MKKLNEEVINRIIKKVIEEIDKITSNQIPIGVSNRHIHLSKSDLESLFGIGYELTKYRELKQPGQYAAEETVKIKGSKGSFENVRILGPVRDKTQIEISLTDGYKLGIKPPVRRSGILEDSSKIEIIGPKGQVKKEEGAIAALRHIHMPIDIAEKMNLKNGDTVNVETKGIREVILKNVLVRVSDKFELEMHLDTDEANACGLKTGDFVSILDKS